MTTHSTNSGQPEDRSRDPSHESHAEREMARVLDRPPPVQQELLRGGALLTSRWVHGPLHGRVHNMSQHVVMTYYGAAQRIDWQEGREHSSSRARVGSITLIPQGREGYWDIEGPLDVSHVYLTAEQLQAAANEFSHGKTVDLIHRVAFDDPTAARILAILGDEAASGETSSRLFVEQAIDLLCAQLIRGHSNVGQLSVAQPHRGLADWQVRRVTDYMHEHLDQDIGVQELANLVQLSQFHFATAFRVATRQAPHAWLTDLRITRARQLLADPARSVTEIALEVGYQTPSSFAAAFRKKTGVTPSHYRRGL